ncbi:hypothetical protein IWQ62_003172 [Dispira parvispora]|uniref:Uncharacterized protein n=1 Tax=Dispira parvispora TaxID=1520584 RepID=A0A9W8E6I6_9FUNG|nr:hypothetical protein IWQ62_003172 [Dispira parvispora]
MPDTLTVVIALLCWKVPLRDCPLLDYLDILHFYLTIVVTPTDTAHSMTTIEQPTAVELSTSIQNLKRRLDQLDSELDLWVEIQHAKPRSGVRRSKSKRVRGPIPRFPDGAVQELMSAQDSRFLRLVCAWDSSCVPDNLLPGQLRRCARVFTEKIWTIFDATTQPLQRAIANVVALLKTETEIHIHQTSLDELYASFKVWKVELSHWLALIRESTQAHRFTCDYTPFQDLLHDRLEQLLRLVDTLLLLDQYQSLYFPPPVLEATTESTFQNRPVTVKGSVYQRPPVVGHINNNSLVSGVFQFVMISTQLMDSTGLPRFVSDVMLRLQYLVDYGLTTRTHPIYLACQKQVDSLSKYTTLVEHNLEGKACAYWFELLNHATDQLLKMDTPQQRDVLNRLTGNNAESKYTE